MYCWRRRREPWLSHAGSGVLGTKKRSLDTTDGDDDERSPREAGSLYASASVLSDESDHAYFRISAGAPHRTAPVRPVRSFARPPSDSGSGHGTSESCIAFRFNSISNPPFVFFSVTPCVILPPNARNPANFVPDVCVPKQTIRPLFKTWSP